MLFVAGTLDSTIGGPSEPLTEKNNRRTLYARISRGRSDPLLALFDFPDPALHSEKRVTTNVPSQRLFFLNSDLVMNEASRLSGGLNNGAGTDEARVVDAYHRIFARAPEKAEMALALQFVRESEPVLEIQENGLAPTRPGTLQLKRIQLHRLT